MNTLQRGTVAVARIIADLTDAGYIVSVPFGEGHRYDLILDDGFLLLRAQCKNAAFRNGCVQIRCYSVNKETGGRRYYQGHADVLVAFCTETQKTYLLPIPDEPFNCFYLRVDPPKNNNNVNIRWAHNYELGL